MVVVRYSCIFLLSQCLQDKPLLGGFIGVKRMGDLDDAPFFAAAKKQFTAREAEEKAIEFICQVSDKLRNPEWHPFKIIKAGQEHKVSICL